MIPILMKLDIPETWHDLQIIVVVVVCSSSGSSSSSSSSNCFKLTLLKILECGALKKKLARPLSRTPRFRQRECPPFPLVVSVM